MSLNITELEAKEVYQNANTAQREFRSLVDQINRMIRKYNQMVTDTDTNLDEIEADITSLLTIQNLVRCDVNCEHPYLSADDGEFIYIRPRA